MCSLGSNSDEQLGDIRALIITVRHTRMRGMQDIATAHAGIGSFLKDSVQAAARSVGDFYCRCAISVVTT